MPKLTVSDLADMVNEDCANHRCFWACGLVKETLALWADPVHRGLLCGEAQSMAEHYLAEKGEEVTT